MASAMVFQIYDCDAEQTGLVWGVAVMFAGSDVPAGVNAKVPITFTTPNPPNSVGQIGTNCAAAIRAYAVANGFTVGTGQVYLPSYTGV